MTGGIDYPETGHASRTRSSVEHKASAKQYTMYHNAMAKAQTLITLHKATTTH